MSIGKGNILKGVSRMSTLPRVFMILPFSEEILPLYEKLKEDFKEEYEFTNAGDLDNQRNILADIVNGINQADVIIADLTGLNANVFYELGLAHALNKKVIIITQDIDELPFDIKSYRAISYSLLFYKITNLIVELRKLLDGAISGDIKFGNPVSDYVQDRKNDALALTDENEEQVETQPNEKEECNDETEEKGFLDYQVEIEEHSKRLNEEITAIGTEMSEMNVSITQANGEIQRVKAHSASINASFARKVLQGVTPSLDSFSMSLKNHVTQINSSWNIIDNAYLGLLESKFIQIEDNKKQLPELVQELEGMKKAIEMSNEQFRSLVNAANGCRGIERRFNKAIGSLTTGLDEYLSTTEIMYASIDRLITRTKTVY